ASSDEFYLDMTGTEKLYRNEPLATTAQRIREAVRQETGLTVSIGGGTSRVIAKLAATMAKPSPAPVGRGARGEVPGVYIVEAGSELDFMRQFSLADIHGVGPRFQERLAKLGLRSVDDALSRDLPTLIRWLGDRGGKWLHNRVRGIDGGEAITQAAAKSISRDDTFSRDLNDEVSLDEKLRWQ